VKAASNDSRPDAALPKYSALEIERRWLVDLPAVGDLSRLPCRLLEDLYITDSGLRLRKISDPNGETIYKFGKKYGKRSRLAEPITTLFLTEREYRQLAILAGVAATKRRYSIASGSLDVFPASCSVEAVFEMEFRSEAEAENYAPPTFVTREVTGDARFSGFAIARSCATA
jgi:CYTH domain-containing protein